MQEEGYDGKVYFLGKLLWSKGIDNLMELVTFAKEKAGLDIECDMYGGGPDRLQMEVRSRYQSHLIYYILYIIATILTKSHSLLRARRLARSPTRYILITGEGALAEFELNISRRP